MKRLICCAVLMVCFILFGCKNVREEIPLIYTLSTDKGIFDSFEEVMVKVTLKNVGNKSILVNARMAFRTQSFYPPDAIEGLFLIADSHNRPVITKGKIDIGFPKSDFFVVLSPDESIQKNVRLQGLGFDAEDFKTNEIYSVVVVYQNSLDVKQTIDGKEIQAWKGRVISSAIYFQIAPP